MINQDDQTQRALRHFYALDLVRLFSALLVVIYHLSKTSGSQMAWPAPAAEAPLSWMAPVSWVGWVGVQVFFVLSGFIISASAMNSDWRGFVKKRAIRILPALWLAIPLTFALRLIHGEPLLPLIEAAVRSAFLIPQGPYIDGVIWTLVLEAVFYALVAGLLMLPGRWGPFHRKLTLLAIVMGGLSTLFIGLHWIIAAAGLGIDPSLEPMFNWFGFDVLLLRHGAFFALGMLLFEALEGRFGRIKQVAMLAFAGACCLQIYVFTGPRHLAIAPILVWATAVAVAMAGVFYSEYFTPRRSRSLVRHAGSLTYPLYLNHYVVAQAALPLLAGVIANTYLLGAVMLSVLLTLASMIALGPERALQSWAKSQFLAPRQITQPGLAETVT